MGRHHRSVEAGSQRWRGKTSNGGIEGGRPPPDSAGARRRGGTHNGRRESCRPCAPRPQPGRWDPSRRRDKARERQCFGEVGALVEADQAAHRGAIGLGRYRAHDFNRMRAPAGSAAGPIMRSTILGREIGHGLAGIERAQAVGDELLLERAVGIAEGRAGAGEHGGSVTIRPPPQHRLRDHAAHRMADQDRSDAGRAVRSVPRRRPRAHRNPAPQQEGGHRSPAGPAPPAQSPPPRSSPFAASTRAPSRQCHG